MALLPAVAIVQVLFCVRINSHSFQRHSQCRNGILLLFLGS